MPPACGWSIASIETNVPPEAVCLVPVTTILSVCGPSARPVALKNTTWKPLPYVSTVCCLTPSM